jgi:hypothetical protein
MRGLANVVTPEEERDKLLEAFLLEGTWTINVGSVTTLPSGEKQAVLIPCLILKMTKCEEPHLVILDVAVAMADGEHYLVQRDLCIFAASTGDGDREVSMLFNECDYPYVQLIAVAFDPDEESDSPEYNHRLRLVATEPRTN